MILLTLHGCVLQAILSSLSSHMYMQWNSSLHICCVIWHIREVEPMHCVNPMPCMHCSNETWVIIDIKMYIGQNNWAYPTLVSHTHPTTVTWAPFVHLVCLFVAVSLFLGWFSSVLSLLRWDNKPWWPCYVCKSMRCVCCTVHSAYAKLCYQA